MVSIHAWYATKPALKPTTNKHFKTFINAFTTKWLQHMNLKKFNYQKNITQYIIHNREPEVPLSLEWSKPSLYKNAILQ